MEREESRPEMGQGEVDAAAIDVEVLEWLGSGSEPRALVPASRGHVAVGDLIQGLPAIIQRAGPHAAERTIEFFTARIRNPNTRRAYGRAASRFFAWMEGCGLALEEIRPVHVSAWVEDLGRDFEPTSVKQQLAGVRMLFDYLVTGGVLAANPAAAVRGSGIRGLLGGRVRWNLFVRA